MYSCRIWQNDIILRMVLRERFFLILASILVFFKMPEFSLLLFLVFHWNISHMMINWRVQSFGFFIKHYGLSHFTSSFTFLRFQPCINRLKTSLGRTFGFFLTYSINFNKFVPWLSFSFSFNPSSTFQFSLNSSRSVIF